MVMLALDIDRSIRERTDAGVYADIFGTVDDISDSSAKFAENGCFKGFVGGFSGGERDQACTAYGLSLRTGWLTLTMQLETAEMRAGY
jgi:hypothetical protein